MKRVVFLSVLFLLAACAREKEMVPAPEGPVLYAAFSTADTRTGFDGDTYVWRTGDRIRVAAVDGSTIDYRYAGEDTAGEAAFTPTSQSTSSVLFGEGGFAIYPSLAASNCMLDGNTLTLNLKNNSSWSEGNVEAPMIARVREGEVLSFTHLGGLLKVTLSNIPVSACKLMVRTPGYAINKQMPVQGWEGYFAEDKPYVQAYESEDGLLGQTFPAGAETERVFYVPLPVGPGTTHAYPKVVIYLVDGDGNTISGSTRTASGVVIERGHIKPMAAITYPDLDAPYTVSTLFGTGPLQNAVAKKVGGDKSMAVFGALRGMVWLEADKRALLLEQSQTLRIWDLASGTVSDPITYGDSNHVPWLGNEHDGKVWFAEKAKAKVYTYDPGTNAVTQIAAQSDWDGKSVMDILFDDDGNAYVAVRDRNTIYKYAGGDVTASPSLTINLGKWPNAMAFDADGNLIVATNGCQLLKVNPVTGSYSAIAGILDAKAFDDGTEGSPLTAKFSANLADIAIAPNGDIYVADWYRIRRVRKGSAGYENAVVSTIAGSSQAANISAIKDGTGSSATFRQLGGLLLNGNGTILYITDQGTGQIRKLYLGEDNGPVVSKPVLRVGTFNIRFITDKDTDERSWDFRKTGVVQLIKDYGFDIIGFQESTTTQQNYLKAQLPGYTFYSSPEGTCMAWKTDKYVLLDEGSFYLSPTPDIWSTPYPGWVSTNPGRVRVCVWVRLEDRETGRKFYHFNTHLEVTSSGTSISEEEAVTIRTKSAELICNRAVSLNPSGDPVILTGDMNSATTESAHTEYFKVQFTDAYYRTAELGFKHDPVATYNAYSYEADQRSKWYHRVDYVYYKGALDATYYRVIDDKYNGYFVSDHWPVVVDLALD